MRHSVIERLIDRSSGRKGSRRYGTGGLRDLAEEIRQDVEHLLNTRNCRTEDWLDENPDLAGSIVAYGMPDSGHVNLSSQQDVNDLRKRIEAVIERFEPRLSRVRAKVLERPKDLSQDVVLEINATIRLEDYQERVTWNSMLKAGTIELRGE